MFPVKGVRSCPLIFIRQRDALSGMMMGVINRWEGLVGRSDYGKSCSGLHHLLQESAQLFCQTTGFPENATKRLSADDDKYNHKYYILLPPC